MKRLTLGLLLLLSALPFATYAESYKTIPMQENGTTTAYVSVPDTFECNVKIPDEPTAFCAGPGKSIYHLTSSMLSNPVYPQQYFNSLLQQLSSESPEAKIVKQYRVPEITNHIMQRDTQVIYRNGQQTVTYAFDVVDTESNSKSSAAFAISSVPNNGAPITIVEIYGFTAPKSGSSDFTDTRNEMIRFARSYQYDRGWVQSANVQHRQFLSNLSAKQRTFAVSQQRKHQSNMDALDRSHKNYMDRSAASDRGQSQFVDSIHERQQFIDNTTGARYEADGYYDYNYVNPNDSSMYYRSNDPLVDPNNNNNQGEYYNQLQEYNYGR